MTGWIIFGAVVLLIVLLLICPIVVYFEYGDDIILRLRYLFVIIFRIPPKTKKQKRKDKKDVKKADKAAKAAEIITEAADAPKKDESQTDKASANSDEKKTPAKKKPDSKNKAAKPKPTLSEIFAVVKMLAESLGKPLKKLLHRTRITNMRLDIICGGDDAAAAALNYGKTNIVVGNALGWLDMFFTVVKPDINIGVDFESEDTLTEMSCKIKLSLGAALAFLIVGLVRVVKNSKGNKEVLSALNKLRG